MGTAQKKIILSRYEKLFYIGLFGSLFIVVPLYFLCEWVPFSEGESLPACTLLLFFDMFLAIPYIFAGLLSFVIVPISLIIVFFIQRQWKVRLLVANLFLILCGLFFYVERDIRWSMRKNACQRIIANGQPIVDAIKKYEAIEKKYPNSLDELVPAYIKTIPITGLRGYPYYEYHNLTTYKDGGYQEQLYKQFEATWELKVRVERVFGWDSIFYWPSRRYPDMIYGGDTELIQNWAYVHE